jgi:ABC-2 type transport system permease protein
VRLVWTCTLKELRRLRRDPIALGIWLGMPILICLLLVLMFGRGEATPQGKLLVADEDGSLVSSLLAGAFSQGPLGKMLVVEKVSERDGRRRINRGDGSALLVIPRGFGAAALRNQPSQLELVKNPSQSILPQIVEESVSLVPEAVFYLQAIAGDRLRSLSSGTAPSDQSVAESSIAFRHLGETVSNYLDPRRIDLETDVVERQADRSLNMAAAFIPSMVFLAVLFLAMGFSGEVWKERRQGVLRRLLVTPARVEAFLMGRVLSLALVLLLAVTAGLMIGRAVTAIPARMVLAGAGFTVLAGIALYLLLQLLVIYAGTERAANVVANLTMFPLAMAGGSFFPFEVMPAWLAGIGRWTPNGWSLRQLSAMLADKSSPWDIVLACAGAIVVASVEFALVARRLRRGFVV